MHDLILEGGTLVDGTGAAPRKVDVAGMAPGDLRAVESDDLRILVCNDGGIEIDLTKEAMACTT